MTSRPRPLALEAADFRRIGHALVDAIADHLATLPSRPVTRGDAPDAIRALLGADAPLPDVGGDPATLVESAARLVFERSLFNGHPRFFGYIERSIRSPRSPERSLCRTR